jgi:hypothetical protein
MKAHTSTIPCQGGRLRLFRRQPPTTSKQATLTPDYARSQVRRRPLETIKKHKPPVFRGLLTAERLRKPMLSPLSFGRDASSGLFCSRPARPRTFHHGILSSLFRFRDGLRRCRRPVRRGAAAHANPRETVRAFEDDAGNTFLGCDCEAPATAGAFDSGHGRESPTGSGWRKIDCNVLERNATTN